MPCPPVSPQDAIFVVRRHTADIVTAGCGILQRPGRISVNAVAQEQGVQRAVEEMLSNRCGDRCISEVAGQKHTSFQDFRQDQTTSYHATPGSCLRTNAVERGSNPLQQRDRLWYGVSVSGEVGVRQWNGRQQFEAVWSLLFQMNRCQGL